jgi:hypothetical protein
MPPLVSIVTPSFNQAAFLEDTLSSVLAQDYTPLEYIVIDGASSDGSQAIIQRYADRLAWWVSEPDAGQAEAINKGLQHARGEIVAWLNSDDLYLPGAISRAVQALEIDPELGMVFGEAISIDPQGQPINRLAFEQRGLADLLRFRIICQPAVFLRRSVLEKAGLLDPSYHFMLDHQLWIRMAYLAPIQYVPYPPLAAARHHPAAKNVAQSSAFSAEILRLEEWIECQPDLAGIVTANRRSIRGGAYRLAARYLLDGGQPLAALQAYFKALRFSPRYALQHWHRMLYAVASLVGGKALLDPVRSRSTLNRPNKLNAQLHQAFSGQLDHWPGIQL